MVDIGPCALFIPHKKWAYGTEMRPKPAHPHWEEDNYAYLEQWSIRFLQCFPH